MGKEGKTNRRSWRETQEEGEIGIEVGRKDFRKIGVNAREIDREI